MEDPQDDVHAARPLVLIRGFGGLGIADERRVAYQGFNDGTVYPHKRGENYIYEGLVLRLLKSDWKYQDATNIVSYHSHLQAAPEDLPDELAGLRSFFEGRLVADPAMALDVVRSTRSVANTIWVFRYYDFEDRSFSTYGSELVQLIDFIRALAAERRQPVPKVDVVAHSMGGLIVRHAVQVDYPRLKDGNLRAAEDHINKIVTLGTPHQGISFQVLDQLGGLGAAEELEAFDPDGPAAGSRNGKAWSYRTFGEHFDLRRLLTVVGTNYRSYGNGAASLLNRLASVPGEYGPRYNRSDGLVKQAYAQVPGAPRTFVHKCHGGEDSLVTSRESFEVAMRFFHGDVRARLRLVEGRVTRGKDAFGRSEFFLGVCIKPRMVDFELFHQSAEAENCYGPFHSEQLDDDLREGGFDWLDPAEWLIWEGWLDTRVRRAGRSASDLVVRLDVYVGERDSWGMGFSDNRVFQKQYYVQAFSEPEVRLFLHTGERYLSDQRPTDTAELLRLVEAASEEDGEAVVACPQVDGEWRIPVHGTGFTATFGLRLAREVTADDRRDQAVTLEGAGT
ncbi:GPI inositol-deacylase [Geodermatophilus sp. YIM 151500]|uniref:esterase/lipase family protein n=1 Tax=Geodermatophilus sp. YIM 151500 TaxID=2984531 RepID=UPI0021E4E3C9|nr:GPI inositol-deacylase [Geodermatophilus sp. YIM 151500]MCV2489184.1 GPI inositol-deacylase [Geodermatophilus sp. YIM 151500]